MSGAYYDDWVARRLLGRRRSEPALWSDTDMCAAVECWGATFSAIDRALLDEGYGHLYELPTVPEGES